jgi:hypothetical protein
MVVAVERVSGLDHPCNNHASIDTVIVYAKLYPSELVDSYRGAMLGVYSTLHGADALRPTAEEWAAFSASCNRGRAQHSCSCACWQATNARSSTPAPPANPPDRSPPANSKFAASATPSTE